MLRFALLLISALAVSSVASFGGGDDKFIKKYAMMKIYESCFGPEVVKQIRREMKEACAKCASMETRLTPTTPSQLTTTNRPSTAVNNNKDGVVDPENSLYANQQSFDAEKLHQAILAYRPNTGPAPPFIGYQQPYYQRVPNPVQFYYPPPYPVASSPYIPLYGQPLIGNQRVSRDMNIKDQLELLTSRMTGRVKNVTCVMQELGYLDDNLEPNFAKISERIANLPISDELRRDMQDGVAFCQQFSQCVPEVRKDRSPLSRELIKPMFFFKCYKHKKLEACIMKDVREKYTGVSEDDFDGDVEIRRQGREMKDDDKTMDELASSMYEFLYGNEIALNIENMF